MTNKEAIDIFKCLAWHERRPDEEEIEQAIKTLEGERPKGKWEYTTNGIIYCNQCNHYLGFKGNYCPNCGADMRSVVDEGLHERAVSDLSKTVDDLYKRYER